MNLLPALPKCWPSGSVQGLRARGGFEVDIKWNDGQLARATVRSKLGGPCRLRSGATTTMLATQAGGSYSLNAALH
jgi:alpha-L-fucosidase 2